MENNHTIAAISTAMAESGIGIVRMSGEEAFAIADKIYKNKKGKRLSDQKTHTIHYGFIEEEGKVIDEVLVMLMRGPRRRLCCKKDSGSLYKKWSQTGTARRIYKESIFKWKDGLVTGRGSH